MKTLSLWNSELKEQAEPIVIRNRAVSAVISIEGIKISDPEITISSLCLQYAKALAEYSCGQCIPCRVGTRALVDLFERINRDRKDNSLLDIIYNLSDTVSTTSLCEIGKATAIFKRLIVEFRDTFQGTSVKGPGDNEDFTYKSFLTAPCMEACPIHLDIPRYVEAIKNRQFQEGLNLILQRLPLPGVLGRVCVRPCEFNCRRTLVDEPIQIRHLKRFLADHALKDSTPDCQSIPEISRNYQKPKKLPRKSSKIAIIGAGPAGLSCGYFLALKGYEVTIFESLSEPGGMAAVGIPDYRLPRDILRGEVKAIEELGVRIQYNRSLGVDFTIEDLESEGFRAIFLGLGCHCHKSMGVKGEDEGYEGFIPGVYFLRNINLGLFDQIPKGKKIAVVGGGNVAIDCVRSALRVGFQESSLIYRRTIQEMPADFVEVRDAKLEGVKFYFLAAPKRIVAENKKIKGIECLWMQLGEPDVSGRKRPVEVPGSEFFVEADVVVPAIGQEGDYACLNKLAGIEITKKGSIIVNEHLMSSRKGVFSGGDCVSGPDVLIKACAQGRKAALKIDEFLKTGKFSDTEEDIKEDIFKIFKPFDPKESIPFVYQKRRIPVSHEPTLERKADFREVDKGFTEEEAVAEAGRCLRCYRVITVAERKA